MGDNLRGRVAAKTNGAATGAATAVAEPETAAVVPEQREAAPVEPDAAWDAQVPAPAAVPVVVALARVMADVRSVGKNQLHRSNTAGTWKFRGIDDVINAVGPALRNHGVIVLPELLEVTYRDVTTKGGNASRECTVRVAYTFVGPDGSTLRAVTPGESLDAGDKGTAKAMSVAFRIALLQALCLPTDEPDPDSAAYQRDVSPAPDLSPAQVAFRQLRSLTEQRGWDALRVSNAFWVQYAVTPLEARADQLLAFTAAIDADPDTVLALADQVRNSG